MQTEQQGKDLTKGNITKQLWSVSWPMMLSMFFYTFYNLVDAFWVAKISPSAIAAVSISQITLFILISLAMGIAVGSAVLIGMSIGAGKYDEAERILGQGYALSLIAAFFFTIVALVFREQILTFSGAQGKIFPLALPYFTVTSMGSVLVFLMMTTSTAFNAQGDNFTMTKLFAISALINVVLDPVMIFGWSIMPAFGVVGAAYATVISQVILMALALPVVMNKRMMVRLRLENIRLHMDSVKKVFDIGIPASLTQTLNPLGFSILMALVSAVFLEAGAAAFSIGFRIEFFAFIPAVGFGFGAMALIGQNIGANNLDRVRQVFRTSVMLASGTALIFGALAALLAPLIVGIFTDDTTVTYYARLYFYIVPIGYAFFAAAFIEASIFQGMGKSWPGFWITGVRVGLAAFLAFIAVKVLMLPIGYVWLSIVVSSVLVSIGGYIWVRHEMKKLKFAESEPILPHPASAEESMTAPVA